MEDAGFPANRSAANEGLNFWEWAARLFGGADELVEFWVGWVGGGGGTGTKIKTETRTKTKTKTRSWARVMMDGYWTSSGVLEEWELNSGAYMHWISAMPV